MLSKKEIENRELGIPLKQILYELINQTETGISLATKYKVTSAYVSQIKKKLSQLQIKPKIINERLVCTKCKEEKLLEFHHNHDTGRPIALICHGCNIKLGKRKWEFDKSKPDIIPENGESVELKLTKLLKMIDDGFLVVDPKKIKNREDDIKWLESLS